MGAPSVDIRLQRGVKHEFPILDDLAEQGGTHYIALPLPGMDAQLSVATRAPGGFSDSATSLIELSLPVLALLIDGPLKDLVLDTVLSCYVGALPAEQIKRGNIRPGGMLDIHGAIWFSDIRNYSTHTQNTAAEVFITRLNAYYECVVPIIYAHGGEVLKFIGDAVLAIFADDDSQAEDGCRRALSAALASNQALTDRHIEFDHGIGLHVGRFQFGNVGSLRRLDFTVIGNEVNVAARIEAQCKVLHQRILMSEPFVANCDLPVSLVARVPLKGIAGDFGLFAPRAGDAAISC
jgi:adenylate cyclase